MFSTFRLFAALLPIVCFAGTTSALAAPATVIFIRHAEKPDPNDCTPSFRPIFHGPNSPLQYCNELSPAGWARAAHLPQMFQSPALRRFGPPAAIFAMHPHGGDGTLRPQEMVSYLSNSFRTPIQVPYESGENDLLANQILSDHRYDGRMVLICWEHKSISDFGKKYAFGEPELKKFDWSGNDYSSALILHLNRDGSSAGLDQIDLDRL